MIEIKKKPIIFTPYLKSVIWGGEKICKYKDIKCSGNDIGESWEISAVPGHISVVESGEYKGLTLTDLICRFGSQLLGKRVFDRYHGKFPLLFKIIDANDNLSVQVHPDDSLAMERHNCPGKTEMWYIIDAEKGARIYAGLSKSITPEEYEAKVADGSFTDVLATHDSEAGDVFFLPAGRVHAIGAGNLLAEIQESSDITYRIFDYNRKDANGNPRELHTSLAKDAIDYTVYDNYKSPAPAADESYATLVDCSYFKVSRVELDGKMNLDFDPDSYTVVMCLEGELTIKYSGEETIVKAAHTVLLPAVMSSIEVTGKSMFLTIQS